MQDGDGLKRVVAYTSHSLTAAERRWSSHDRELWGKLWAVRNFRHYLGLHPFTIVTDHRLPWLPIDNDRTGWRRRWALELDSYDWGTVHKSGVHHTNAAALSRRPDNDAEMMDGGSPGAVCVLVHKATQTGTEDDPSTVSAVDFPALIAAPVEDSGSGTGADRAWICALAHDGSSVKKLKQCDTDIDHVLAWLVEGQRTLDGG